MSLQFKDYFSGHATAYAEARPRYPAELFKWLASLTPQHVLAWDCGTGNGQAALGLAAYYQEVVATDPSREQIGNVFPHERVTYRIAPAEMPGIEPHCVDLVTVAQAVHWFDRPKFYAQVKQVLKPDGAIAVWCYGVCTITPEIDAVLRIFYDGTVGRYWPPERRLIDEAYRTIEFPFCEIPPPAFSMRQHWNLTQFLAYLDTWSAVQRFLKQHGRDPLKEFAGTLSRYWGKPASKHWIEWPLYLRVGKSRA